MMMNGHVRQPRTSEKKDGNALPSSNLILAVNYQDLETAHLIQQSWLTLPHGMLWMMLPKSLTFTLQPED